MRSKNAFSVFVWCEKLHKYKCLVCFAEVRMPCVCGLVFFFMSFVSFYEFRGVQKMKFCVNHEKSWLGDQLVLRNE